MNYYLKYLKYKNKYLILQQELAMNNKVGGMSYFSKKDKEVKQIQNPIAKDKEVQNPIDNLPISEINNTIKAAAVLSGTALVAKAVLLTLTAAGLTTPSGPAIAVLLLIIYELTELYKANQSLIKLMHDVMDIIINCYRLNELIDKSIEIFFIYIFNHKEFSKIQDKEKISSNEYNKLFKTAQANATHQIESYNKDSNKDNFIFAPNDVLEKNEINDKHHTLIGKLGKNKEIDSQLYDKIKLLTLYLLNLSPTTILEKLNKDPKIQNSSFGKLLKEEIQTRNKSFISKTYALAERVYSRTGNPKNTINKIVKELSVINGYYNLMINQYNFQKEYYSREFLPSEYKKIWRFIERQEEYINFMIPQDPNTEILNIVANEKDNLKEVSDKDFTNDIKTLNDDDKLDGT